MRCAALRYQKGGVMDAGWGMCACLEGVGGGRVWQGSGTVRRPQLLAFRRADVWGGRRLGGCGDETAAVRRSAPATSSKQRAANFTV